MGKHLETFSSNNVTRCVEHDCLRKCAMACVAITSLSIQRIALLLQSATNNCYHKEKRRLMMQLK